MQSSGATSSDEKSLLKECLAGSAGAWERFTERYTPSAAAAAGRVFARTAQGSQQADIDDVVQATFSRLLEDDGASLRRFRWRCSLSTYVAVAAARAAYDLAGDRIKHETSAPSVEALSDFLPDESAGPEEAASTSELREAVGQAISSLPAASALTARLYYLEGWSLVRIAAFRRVPYNTAAGNLLRARALLAESLRGL